MIRRLAQFALLIAFLSLCGRVNAQSHVNHGEIYSSAGGTVVVTMNNSISSGVLMLINLRQDYGGGSAGDCNVAPDPTNTQTAVDSSGATYTLAAANNGGPCAGMFYAISSTGGGNTVTVSGANTNASVTVDSWSGMSTTSNGVYVAKSAYNAPGAATSLNSGSFTPGAGSPWLMVGMFMVNGGPTFTPGTDYTSGNTMTTYNTGTNAAFSEFYFPETTSRSYQATGSISASNAYAGIELAFTITAPATSGATQVGAILIGP